MTPTEAIKVIERMLVELPFYRGEGEALKLAITALYVVYKQPERFKAGGGQ